MSDKLQQAIQATRAGDKKNAQFLLTEAIQEDPANPQSWYLLSLLVDDKAKKQTYISKVLDLDPDHVKAHQQLLALTETDVTKSEESVVGDIDVVLSSDSPDLEAQDSGETLPDWMADDLPPGQDEKIEVVAETAVTSDQPIPDWLDEDLGEDWDEAVSDIEVVVAETTDIELKEDDEPKDQKDIVVEKTSSVDSKSSNETRINLILTGLIIIAIIVFLILAYLIYNMM